MTPGWKTSEFWLTLAAQATGAIAASGLASTNPVVQVAGLAAAALAQLGYTASRAKVKKSMADAFGATPIGQAKR